MKYIIDIPNSFVDITNGLHIPIDKEGNFRIDTGLKLIPYTKPDREAIEDEVWKFAKIIGSFNGLAKRDLEECFGHTTIQGVMTTYDTYREAKTKYEEWKKQKDEIRVGDEVELSEGVKGLVYIVGEEMLEGAYLNCDGLVPFCWRKKDCRKTGKHFDEIEELLKKVRNLNE